MLTAIFLAVLCVAPVCLSALPRVPTSGFDQVQHDIPHGVVSAPLTYPTSVSGSTGKVEIYTPPGYTTSKKYSVLLLLHGCAGSYCAWTLGGGCKGDGEDANIISDNLIAGRFTDKANYTLPANFILVMPSNFKGSGNPGDPNNCNVQAYHDWEVDASATGGLIAWLQKNYSVYTDRAHYAIAGFSMGGGETIDIGFKNIDQYAYFGPFSAAATCCNPPASYFPQGVETAKKQIKLMFQSRGGSDFGNAGEQIHTWMDQNGITNYYWIDRNLGHETMAWKDALWNFLQMSADAGWLSQ